MSNVRKAKHGWIFTIIFTILSVLWVLPIVIVFMNSFKLKAYINRFPFQLGPFKMTDGWDRFVAGVQKAFVGLTNYAEGIRKINFFNAFGTSLFITICSVAVIILCTSMCAWYIIRVNDKFSKGLYCLCLFSMIVPFQMVMFTLSKLSNMLHLGNPVGIILVYLGFGAGLSVFMFTGFVKSIPLEIEEAAMIDGCSPIQTYFQVVFPILKPTAITVAILQVMWIWNDYLLPYLVLDIRKWKTIPIARETYIKGNLRLVLSVIKRFSGNQENIDDLFQIGCIGLIKSIDNFDDTLGVKFSTYAVPMIIGEIRRYLRDNNSIRVSRSLRDTAYKAIHAKEILMKNSMQEPTLQEIAKEAGLTKEEIVYALDAIQSPVSLYDPVYTDGGDTLYVMDQISDKKNKEDNWVEGLALSDAMNRLNDRENHIVKLRFFEGKTQMEIADEIHISQAQVSRLEKTALKTMKNYLALHT